jgi:uncharacterized damage-inducible protein DinB
MEKTAAELKDAVEAFYLKYKELDDEISSIKLSSDRWTLKEIIGHLIDSASNNHQRFVRLQLTDNLAFPDYDKDQWLNTQFHNKMNFSELLSLLLYFNRLIQHIILNADKNTLDNKWIIQWDENKNSISLKELMLHYVVHLKGHIVHFAGRLDEIKKQL